MCEHGHDAVGISLVVLLLSGSETLTAVEEGGRDERLVEFLDELGLSKYMEVGGATCSSFKQG